MRREYQSNIIDDFPFLDAADIAYESAMWSGVTETVDDIVKATAVFANARRPT